MVRQYVSDHKLPILVAVAGIFIVAILILLWLLFKPDNDLAETITDPIKLEYCGADLDDPCVLSFGRDGDGNTIINLFVPEEIFPAFDLTVIRYLGESVYDCDTSDAAPDTVYCIGAPISLNERIEIRIVSEEDHRLLAVGKFTLTAVLLVPGGGDVLEPAETAAPPRRTPTPTPSPAPTLDDLTPTPEVSYPSYPGSTSYP